MKVLLTGASGFIGQHVYRELLRRGHEVVPFDRNDDPETLPSIVSKCDAIIHLAGENRPKDVSSFETVNVGLTERICEAMKEGGKGKKLIFASSIQAERDCPYGNSKREAEILIEKKSEEYGFMPSIFRLPNVFGKGCRPFYNSVVATWCYQIAHDERTRVDDPDRPITLVYVVDVARAFVGEMESNLPRPWPHVVPEYDTNLGRLNGFLKSCRRSRISKEIPLQEGLRKKLFATYLSYLATDDISYQIPVSQEPRGSFNELLRLGNMGQISMNVIAPHKVKGGHYHETKIEKFICLTGHVVYRMWPVGRKDETTSIDIVCDGDNYTVIDVIPGYFHEIENVGNTDAMTLIWASEEYFAKGPDTYRY